MSDTAPERPLPTNVIQALARVIEEMPPVSKDAQYSGGGSGTYSYRSIEAVTAAAQHLIGKYGLVPVPRVVSRRTIEVTVGGKPWTQDELEMVYRFYGPGGVEDYIDVGPVWGLGRDNSDKGTNKASTQAYKVALIQLLCVGDSRHDADSERAETDSARFDPESWFPAHGWKDRAEYDTARKSTNEALAAADEPVKVAFRAWWADQGHEWKDAWPKPLADAVAARLEALIAERGVQTPEGEGAPNPAPTPETPLPAPQSAPVGDSEPLPDPDPTTMALIAFVESLPARQVGEALEARNAALSGASKVRQQRLAKLLAGEGWTPGRGHLPETGQEPRLDISTTATVPPGLPEPLCAWCGHRESTKGELPAIDGNGGWMHAPCRVEWEADKAAAEEPF